MRGRDELNLKEAFELARQTIQALMLINGGAAAAVLAFFGGLLTADHAPTISRPMMLWALACFAGGLVIGTVTSLMGYWVQTRWGAELPAHVTDEAAWNRDTICLNIATVIVGLGGLAAFVIGAILVGIAISGARPQPACPAPPPTMATTPAPVPAKAAQGP